MKAPLLSYLLLVLSFTHFNAVAASNAQASTAGNSSQTSPQLPLSAPIGKATNKKPMTLVQVATGSFPCKHGGPLTVRNTSEQEGTFAVSLGKAKKIYLMRRVHSVSGAVRLESSTGKFVLLQLANKSMLLDLGRGKHLVSDCQSTSQRLFAEKIAADPNRKSILH